MYSQIRMLLRTCITILLMLQSVSLLSMGEKWPDKPREGEMGVQLLASSDNNNCSSNNGDCSSCLNQVNQQGIGICGYCQALASNCSDPSQCQCLAGSLSGPSVASCDTASWYYEACPDEPTELTATYKVSLRLLNIAGVDLKAGTFNADFLLFFEGNRVAYTNRQCNSNNGVCFNILNSVGVPTIVKYQTYFHVQGTFSFEVELSEYPFDNQTLPFLIQDTYSSAQQLQWEIKQTNSQHQKSGIDSHLTFTGWEYDSNSWGESLTQRYNPILLENFSTYVFKFLIKRPPAVGFIKGLLPPLFIVLVICASFSLPAKEMSSRIWIAGSLLISVVLFHSTLAEETPRKGQLTFADHFIISVYIFIFISLAVNIVVIRLFRSGAERLANKIQHLSELASWPGLFIFFFGHFYLNWNTFLVLFLVVMSSITITVAFFILPLISARTNILWRRSCLTVRQKQTKHNYTPYKERDTLKDDDSSPLNQEKVM